MKIKITEANIAKLEDLVSETNGKAVAHTLSANAIVEMAQRAERRLDNAGILQKNRTGTVLFYRSGEKMPGAYKHSRIVNAGGIVRHATGWYLQSFYTTNAFTPEGGHEVLHLTYGGKVDAIDNVCKG